MRNFKELMQALLDGKKVQHKFHSSSEYFYIKNGHLWYSDGHIVYSPSFSNPEDYFEWKDPNLVQFKDVGILDKFEYCEGIYQKIYTVNLSNSNLTFNCLVLKHRHTNSKGYLAHFCDDKEVKLIKENQ